MAGRIRTVFAAYVDSCAAARLIWIRNIRSKAKPLLLSSRRYPAHPTNHGRELTRHAVRTERSGGLAPPIVTRTRPRWRRGIQIPDERASLGPTPFAPTISSRSCARAPFHRHGHCVSACAASLTEYSEHPGVACRVFPWVFPSPPDWRREAVKCDDFQVRCEHESGVVDTGVGEWCRRRELNPHDLTVTRF